MCLRRTSGCLLWRNGWDLLLREVEFQPGLNPQPQPVIQDTRFLEGNRGGPETSALELLTTCPGALNPQGGQKRSEHPLEDSGSPAAAEKMSAFRHDQRACFGVDLKAQIPVVESQGDRGGVCRPGAHTHTHTHTHTQHGALSTLAKPGELGPVHLWVALSSKEAAKPHMT